LVFVYISNVSQVFSIANSYCRSCVFTVSKCSTYSFQTLNPSAPTLMNTRCNRASSTDPFHTIIPPQIISPSKSSPSSVATAPRSSAYAIIWGWNIQWFAITRKSRSQLVMNAFTCGSWHG